MNRLIPTTKAPFHLHRSRIEEDHVKRLKAPEAKSGREDLMRIEAQLVALERATRKDEEHREFESEVRDAAQAHQASPMTDGVFANYALSAPSALAHRCSPLAESQ